MSDEQRWIDQAVALKSELPAQVTISWEAYCRLVAERDEAQALAYECFGWLQEGVQCFWNDGEVERIEALIRRMLLLPWVQERLAKEPAK